MEITIRVPKATTALRWALLLALVAVAMLWPQPGPAMATEGNSTTSPDTDGDVGHYISLALDEDGYPVVSYYEYSPIYDLKVLHCGNANCTAGNSILYGDAVGDVGRFTSLALDASGYPVVSYYDLTNSDLKVLHCNDSNCDSAVNGPESITQPDPDGTTDDVGQYTSLALDPWGNPVISYYDATNDDLKMLHCNDANCDSAVNGPGRITRPDPDGATDDVGQHTSLALDASGYPVVSYYDHTNSDLKMLHCGNAYCNSGNSITSPDPDGATDDVGQYTSLALDASGYPVVSYYDASNDDLKVLHCNDANCEGGDESITAPDIGGDVGLWTSLALDALGDPVISYWTEDFHDLKMLHCDDANCAGDETTNITSPDTLGSVGTSTSLALDASGNPVVSYRDETNDDLKVLHCGDPDCTGVTKPQISFTNLGQYELPKTCFAVHDAGQNPLFDVCDNDFQGPPDSHVLCQPDGVCDDEDPTDGSIRVTVAAGTYSAQVSKAPYNHTTVTGKQQCDPVGGKCALTFLNTPNTTPWHPWDLNGDGLVRVKDIMEVVNHYGQDKP